MKKYYSIILVSLFFTSCGEAHKPIDLRDLCKSWVFEASVKSKEFSLATEEKFTLIPYKSVDHKSAMGWQFEDTGKLISFRIVDGKKQDFGFIHGLWAVNEDRKMLINMDGTKPIYKIIELSQHKLIIKKDGVLAD